MWATISTGHTGPSKTSRKSLKLSKGAVTERAQCTAASENTRKYRHHQFDNICAAFGKRDSDTRTGCKYLQHIRAEPFKYTERRRERHRTIALNSTLRRSLPQFATHVSSVHVIDCHHATAHSDCFTHCNPFFWDGEGMESDRILTVTNRWSKPNQPSQKRHYLLLSTWLQ